MVKSKLIPYVLAGALLTGIGIHETNAQVSIIRIEDATPVFEKDGVKYFDPFDLSVTPYEELTDREKEYVDAIETGKIRRPGNAPGLEHLRPYFGKKQKSNSLVDRMKSSFMEGYQKSLRRRGH